MLTLHDRSEAVFAEAWRMLPPIKRDIEIAGIVLEDMDAVHGSWNVDTHTLTLNERLFLGDNPAHIDSIDIDGNDPPRTYPLCSRALHTCIHELAHAIGGATGLDDSHEWLVLSGWVHAWDDPVGAGRYVEHRPGWEQGPSDWRFRLGTWFPREYSSRSPFEDFADCCTHITLGWTDYFGVAGAAKLAYLRRYVWQESGMRSMQAAAVRWRERLRVV